jgi:hypothetical protein
LGWSTPTWLLHISLMRYRSDAAVCTKAVLQERTFTSGRGSSVRAWTIGFRPRPTCTAADCPMNTDHNSQVQPTSLRKCAQTASGVGANRQFGEKRPEDIRVTPQPTGRSRRSDQGCGNRAAQALRPQRSDPLRQRESQPVSTNPCGDEATAIESCGAP